MALIEIKAEPGLLKELVQTLKQIAAALNRAYPAPLDPERLRGMKRKEADDLWEFDPFREAEREEEEDVRGQTRYP